MKTLVLDFRQGFQSKANATTGRAFSPSRPHMILTANNISEGNVIEGGRIVNANNQTHDREGSTKAQFMADLKRASARVQPGKKMDRDEAIQDVIDTYGNALKGLRD